jgi:hypothetical protein
MVWLLDENGNVKPEYANDYALLKRKVSETVTA